MLGVVVLVVLLDGHVGEVDERVVHVAHVRVVFRIAEPTVALQSTISHSFSMSGAGVMVDQYGVIRQLTVRLFQTVLQLYGTTTMLNLYSRCTPQIISFASEVHVQFTYLANPCTYW